jgi:antitoxin VapB
MSTKDPETERLAKGLAHLIDSQSRKAALVADIAEIRRRWSEMPVVDDRTPEQVLGYDEDGLPR